MGEWWNGIHVRLRTVFLRDCRFDSCLAHQKDMQNKIKNILLFTILGISIIVFVFAAVFGIKRWKQNKTKRSILEVDHSIQKEEPKEESMSSKCFEYELCETRANARYKVELHRRINYLNEDPKTMSYEDTKWKKFTDDNPEIAFDLPTNLVSLVKTYVRDSVFLPLRSIEYSFSTGAGIFSQIVEMDMMINKEDIDYWKDYYIDGYNNDVYTNSKGEEIRNIVTDCIIDGRVGKKVDFYGMVQHPFDLYYLDVLDEKGALKYFVVITIEKENLREYCNFYDSECDENHINIHEEVHLKATKRILDSIELY